MVYAQVQITKHHYLYAYFKDVDDIHIFIDTLEEAGEFEGITYTLIESDV